MHDLDQSAAPTIPAGRHLPLPGTWNVRDVGGYPADGGTTRWATLLRSDALHRLDSAGRARLAELGLRTVIDLRDPGERQAAPDALNGLDVDVRHLPVMGGRLDTSQPLHLESEAMYRLFVDEGGGALAGAVAALARPGALPGLVHCMVGKDRTGLVIALALTAVGVDEAVVVQDYALTSEFFTDDLLAQARTRLAAAGLSPELVESTLGCPPELMAVTLAHVRDRYGSVLEYLERHGVEQATVEALKRNLVEPA